MFYTAFGFLISGLKSAFSQSGVVLALTIMNTINECCRSYTQCKLRTPYFLKRGAVILPLVFLCDLFDYLPTQTWRQIIKHVYNCAKCDLNPTVRCTPVLARCTPPNSDTLKGI